MSTLNATALALLRNLLLRALPRGRYLVYATVLTSIGVRRIALTAAAIQCTAWTPSAVLRRVPFVSILLPLSCEWRQAESTHPWRDAHLGKQRSAARRDANTQIYFALTVSASIYICPWTKTPD